MDEIFNDELMAALNKDLFERLLSLAESYKNIRTDRTKIYHVLNLIRLGREARGEPERFQPNVVAEVPDRRWNRKPRRRKVTIG